MSRKIVICVFALTVCTSNIFECAAFAVNSKSPRNQDDLTKIAKGRDVPIEDYPFIVSLQRPYAHTCGGSLVHPLWVLTAAHCISGPAPTKINQVGHVDTILDASEFTVVAGLTSVFCVRMTNNEDPIPGSPNRRKVAEVHRHEEYVTVNDKSRFWNDIGLVKLESSFGKELPVQLVPLPPPDFVEPTDCVAIGWGFQPDEASCKQGLKPKRQAVYPNVKTHPLYFRHLKAVELKIADRSYCTGRPYNLQFLGETQLCLDTTATGNPCKGDSGGPLLCGDGGYQVGLTSTIHEHDAAKCNDNPMTVYTRVANYREWIAKFVPNEGNEAARTCQLDQAFIYHILIMYVMLM